MGNKGTFQFKTEYTLEERKNMSKSILSKYPNRIPIICEKEPNSELPSLKKTRYLVENNIGINQFQYRIRKKLNIIQDSALFICTSKGKLLIGDTNIMEVYNINKDKEDNFLYLYYVSEKVWG